MFAVNFRPSHWKTSFVIMSPHAYLPVVAAHGDYFLSLYTRALFNSLL